MATATKNFGDITLNSGYYAYTTAEGDTYLGSANTVNSSVYTCKLSTFIGPIIPAGSTIQSAKVIFGYRVHPLHGASIRTLTFNGVANTFVNSGDAVTIDSDSTFKLTFKSGTNNTSYPPPPGTSGTANSLYNSSTLGFEDFSVQVTYTAPTDATVSGVTGASYGVPSATKNLTWSAANGTNNAITSFTIQRRLDGGSWSNIVTGLSSATRSYSVAFPSTAGRYYEFQVIAVAPYGNGSAISGKFYAYSAPVVSNVKVNTNTNDIYLAASGAVTLAWSAVDGEYNAVSGYKIQRSINGAAYADLDTIGNAATKTYSTTASATAGNNIKYRVLAQGQTGLADSAYVNSPFVYSYSKVTSPTSLTLTPTTAIPGASIALSWSGALAGVGVSIKEYEVYQNSVKIATVTGTSHTFTAPVSGTYVYEILAIGSVAGYDATSYSPTKTLTVEIPYSTFVLNKSTVALDDTSTIQATITPAGAGLTHKIKWYINSTYKYPTDGTEKDLGSDTTDVFTTILDWVEAFPNAVSGAVYCEVFTYDGVTLIGSQVKSFTGTVPSSVVPTVSLELTSVDGFNSMYIKGRSKCTLNPNLTGSYGSTIASWALSGGGYTGSTDPWTTGILNSIGTLAMVAIGTDSRGRTAQASVNITVVDYRAPVLITTAVRALEDGTVDAQGTYIKVVGKSTVMDISGNGVAVFTVKYRKVGDPTWETAIAMDATPISGTQYTQVIGSGNVLVTDAYEVFITTTDSVGVTSTSELLIEPAKFLFDFHETKAALGKLAEVANTFLTPDTWAHQGKLFKSMIETIDGPPLIVASTALVDNLNADQLDGLHEADFARSTITGVITDLNSLTRSGIYHITITNNVPAHSPFTAVDEITPVVTNMTLIVDGDTSSTYITQICIGKVAVPMTLTRVTTDGGTTWSTWLNPSYGLGALYFTAHDEVQYRPATLFGGGWTLLTAGTFPVAAGTGYAAGDTGGSATHTLSIAEIPTKIITDGSGNQVRVTSSTHALPASGSYHLLVTGAWNSTVLRYDGGGEAHNNMPPWKAYYIWERTS